MGELINMIGFHAGKLTVIKRAGLKNGQSVWLCKCDCGNTVEKYGGQLRKMQGLSCGCDTKQKFQEHAHRTIAKKKHGDSYARLYYVWNDMKGRCYNPNDTSYHNYGAIGITVCDEWKNNYPSFKKWALENGYDPGAPRGQCTLDRIDTTKGYAPDNCRWANMLIQSNNRRNSYTITLNGVTHTAREWADVAGIPAGVIYSRKKAGWPAEEILSKNKYDQHHKVIGTY